MTNIPDDLWNSLAEASARINLATEEIAKSIATINLCLSRLNIGLPVWLDLKPIQEVVLVGSEDHQRIGYAKIYNRWGLCLGSGNKEWHFNDAPRGLRLEAINRIPDLLVAITKETNDIYGLIEAKLLRMRGHS